MASAEERDQQFLDDLVLADDHARQLLGQALVGGLQLVRGLQIVLGQLVAGADGRDGLDWFHGFAFLDVAHVRWSRTGGSTMSPFAARCGECTKIWLGAGAWRWLDRKPEARARNIVF